MAWLTVVPLCTRRRKRERQSVAHACGSYSDLNLDAEVAEPLGRNIVDLLPVDVALHALGQRTQKAFDVVAMAFGDQFDLAIAQITHIARDRKSPGHALGGVAETDPLHS